MRHVNSRTIWLDAPAPKKKENIFDWSFHIRPIWICILSDCFSGNQRSGVHHLRQNLLKHPSRPQWYSNHHTKNCPQLGFHCQPLNGTICSASSAGTLFNHSHLSPCRCKLNSSIIVRQHWSRTKVIAVKICRAKNREIRSIVSPPFMQNIRFCLRIIPPP